MPWPVPGVQIVDHRQKIDEGKKEFHSPPSEPLEQAIDNSERYFKPELTLICNSEADRQPSGSVPSKFTCMRSINTTKVLRINILSCVLSSVNG